MPAPSSRRYPEPIRAGAIATTGGAATGEPGAQLSGVPERRARERNPWTSCWTIAAAERGCWTQPATAASQASPLNLAHHFYGASPPAAAPAPERGCSASGPSAPGSPGSDSSDFSSASSVSSCGAVESRPRGGARAERLQGTQRPQQGDPGTDSRGPRSGRRVVWSCPDVEYLGQV